MGVTDDSATAYDRVLYPSAVLPFTNPQRLATVAFLRGMRPAPVDHCRVLELGCGAANNLVAMACQLPQSEFVGLDLAQLPIASGQRSVAELGLRNVVLHTMDLCQASSSHLGEFDFIVAHGVYSWVPEPVRERILEICREMLGPQGIAYVSYNAYPQGHFRDLTRGMMRFHSRIFEGLGEKMGHARGLLKLLAESRPNADYYTETIRAQLERILRRSDEALFHDDLNPINQPFYFHEFISQAESHGLQFVGEAEPNYLDLSQFTPEAVNRIRELDGASEIVREQYKDFLLSTGFRRTLLCKKEINLEPDLQVERVRELYAACEAIPVEIPGSNGHLDLVFRHPRGDQVEAHNPLTRAALAFLCAQWPCAVRFQSILEAAAGGISVLSLDGDDSGIVASALAKAYQSGFLALEIFPRNVVNRISERPAISELARFQLERGTSANSQLSRSLEFAEPLAHHLALLLDGTRDRQMLSRELMEFVKSGAAKVYEEGTLVKDPHKIAAIVEGRVGEGLAMLARAGMLVS
jgi:methyltransferase-like protein/SAM-dependent methyltransferase